MKRLIRWALNHVPRPLLQRLAGWAVPVAGLFYVGRGRECPVCGARRRRFLPYGYVAPRADALCPSCLSLERHRLLWLYLTRETDLLRRPQRILHIAPEVCLMKRLRHRAADYTTADLESPLAELHFDVLQIPLPDASYDVLICFLGGLMAIDIVPREATGAALGIVGMASYIGAGLQDIVSGWLINEGKTVVDGVARYDFEAAALFWIAASALSFILALCVSKRSHI